MPQNHAVDATRSARVKPLEHYARARVRVMGATDFGRNNLPLSAA